MDISNLSNNYLNLTKKKAISAKRDLNKYTYYSRVIVIH